MIDKFRGVRFLYIIRDCACFLIASVVILPWTLFLLLRNIFTIVDRIFTGKSST